MKGWRREKYFVIVVREAFFKMLINVVIDQKASLKETARVYSNLISIFSGLEYFGNMELDRGFPMSPTTSEGLKRNCRKHYQYFEMFRKNFLLSYPQKTLPCADRRE